MSAKVYTLAVALALCACSTSPTVTPITEEEVQTVLDVQSEAWNRGDMEAFMATYWESPDLTFVGSTGLTRGHAETLARYLRTYPDEAARGSLAFDLLEVRSIGDDRAALVIGRWQLAREEPAQGCFTLVVERRPEGLRIVHDHSSSDG